MRHLHLYFVELIQQATKQPPHRKEKALRPAIDAVDNWPPAAQDLISTEDERELLDSLVEALSLDANIVKQSRF